MVAFCPDFAVARGALSRSKPLVWLSWRTSVWKSSGKMGAERKIVGAVGDPPSANRAKSWW